MKTIPRGSFTGTNDELRAQLQARIDAFRKACAAHAKTVGVPAPREDDLIEALARSGEPFEIEPAPEKPSPLSAEQLAEIELKTKRAAALHALDEKRLATAALDANAPQEVKEYAAELATWATR